MVSFQQSNPRLEQLEQFVLPDWQLRDQCQVKLLSGSTWLQPQDALSQNTLPGDSLPQGTLPRATLLWATLPWEPFLGILFPKAPYHGTPFHRTRSHGTHRIMDLSAIIREASFFSRWWLTQRPMTDQVHSIRDCWVLIPKWGIYIPPPPKSQGPSWKKGQKDRNNKRRWMAKRKLYFGCNRVVAHIISAAVTATTLQ